MTDTQLEKIENLVLLENSLEHVGFEVEKPNPLFFRAAKEAHLILYRSMVEALRGTANLSITGIPQNKRRITQYQLGDKPWLQIEKIRIQRCKKAWRYSEPSEISEPVAVGEKSDVLKFSNYLQNFYELLAKIQTECFMSQYFGSKPIQISDKQMALLEWLHEQIRNEFEHFIPKHYYVSIIDLIASRILCFEISYRLLFESRNVIPHTDMSSISNGMKNRIDRLKKLQRSDSIGASGT